jgi:hypothetical protein
MGNQTEHTFHDKSEHSNVRSDHGPNGGRQTMIYILLLAIQLSGTLFFIWQELPEFRQVLTNPGVQLPRDDPSDLLLLGVFCAMQIAFWIRQYHVPIPIRRPNVFLHHLFLFFGRLSFIFGSTLFSVLVFRHLPELRPDSSILLLVRHGGIFAGCLFALFFTTLEVERLGRAFDKS